MWWGKISWQGWDKELQVHQSKIVIDDQWSCSDVVVYDEVDSLGWLASDGLRARPFTASAKSIFNCHEHIILQNLWIQRQWWWFLTVMDRCIVARKLTEFDCCRCCSERIIFVELQASSEKGRGKEERARLWWEEIWRQRLTNLTYYDNRKSLW